MRLDPIVRDMFWQNAKGARWLMTLIVQSAPEATYLFVMSAYKRR